jgi:hypothetical protein
MNEPLIETTETPVPPLGIPPIPLEIRDSADLPYDVFVRDYMRQNRPVVVRNSTTAWPALRKWTPEYFKTRFGEKKVQVSYDEAMTFSDFIDGVMASTHERPGPYMYRLFIHEHLPEILADLSPPNPYSFPRRYSSPLMRTHWRRPDGYLKLLIGGIGGRFPVMHFDGENAHATVTEIYGDKEFLAYPPSDGQYLYPNPKIPNKSLISDPLRIDVDRFPLQLEATQHRAVLRPGDMMFIPSGWWHTARALTPSISVGMNIMDGSNWSGFVSEVFRPRRPLRPAPVMNWMYWTGLGHLLSAMERTQERHPAIARALVLPALLAPASSTVAPDPATMHLEVLPRDD